MIAVPGTFCAPLMFAPLASVLRETEDAVELEAVSWMDGSGPWDLASVAAGIAVRLASGSPRVVVGHSTGGAIALQLALEHSEVVAGLVLVDSGPSMRSHGDVGAILTRIRGGDVGEVVEAVIARSFDAAPPAEVADALLDYAHAVDPQAALDVLESQRATDFTDRLPEITCPVAVVHGRRDPVRTVDEAWAFADLLGAELTLLDCGHSPPFESPAAVAAVVAGVVRESRRRLS